MNPQQTLSDVRHAIHSVFKGAVETVMPLRTESAFKEKGVRNLVLCFLRVSRSASCESGAISYSPLSFWSGWSRI